MVKIFLDTNVVIDLIAKRQPFYDDAKLFLSLAKNGLARLFIAESSLGNIYYLVFEVYKIPQIEFSMHDFITLGEIVSGGKEVIYKSLNSDFQDKEDALQYFTAIENKMDFLITRDLKDFKTANQIPVLTPKQFFSS
ncbi:type II toxin-antitoxin system VapC family toxin [Algoriphagus yeomjeoni]|uniref:PIN domain-containing protein n=1 Tax=Algoriphagus yeomjeoni TaxID=291403 RepID=A0A327PTS0_9BACT|nr:PIN domain-containing protein [Algoriphagus yeomjeoni]RAI94804.1 PIN domain-containing protein [Algoriphagus yeomjeoni]